MKKKPVPAKKIPRRAPKGARPAVPPPTPAPSRAKPGHWILRLYVAGQTPKSLTAFSNLKRICEEHLAGRYSIEVIDLVKAPQLAHRDRIVALPTLIRQLPEPIKRIIGDLSNIEWVLVGMDLKSAGAAKPPQPIA